MYTYFCWYFTKAKSQAKEYHKKGMSVYLHTLPNDLLIGVAQCATERKNGKPLHQKKESKADNSLSLMRVHLLDKTDA